MAEITSAQIEQRRALKEAVRQRKELTPAAAEAQAIGLGLPSLLVGYEENHDVTSNATWWLPIAVLFYAWRDLGRTREQWVRYQVWGRDLWREWEVFLQFQSTSASS